MCPILLDLPQGKDQFHRLVLDFTGTLSADGALIPGVEDRLHRLAENLEVTVITADTFGSARKALEGLPVGIQIIVDGQEKAGLVKAMADEEQENVVAVGNGRNDVPMMAVAALGLIAAATSASADAAARSRKATAAPQAAGSARSASWESPRRSRWSRSSHTKSGGWSMYPSAGRSAQAR